MVVLIVVDSFRSKPKHMW